MNQEAHFALTKARIALISQHPFFGTLALRLRLVEDNSLPTMAVDGKSMFYNPEFVNKMTPTQTMFVVAHEVGHCVFEHISRRGDRDPMKWNIAGDFVINAMLKRAGLDMPPMGLYNPDWEDMTTDHVYSLLPNKGGKGGKGQPGLGEPGGAMCEIRDADVKKTPDIQDDWKIATVQAATAAKQAGNLPADLERFVKDLLNPKVDWRTVLRRFVTEITKSDYSWQRPNKYMLSHGVYLPSLYAQGMGQLAAGIDTSGSIYDRTLAAFSSEIQAIREAVRPAMTHAIYCDSDVNHVDSYTPEDVLELKPHGGGGTDFRPPFERVAEEGWRLAAFVYLTDGYGPFPDQAPEYPVLWCMTTDVQPPWGEVVRIEV